MSILNRILRNLSSLIYPPRCLVCREVMEGVSAKICARCLSKISITRFWSYSDNAMAERARDLQPMIVEASALLFYDSYSRPMIHRIKYYREWRGALYLGELLGAYLATSDLYRDIDVVVPIPIHPLRRVERGYNQSEYIATGVAKELGVATNFCSLYRARYSSPQAGKEQVDRWGDDEGGFMVRNGESLEGKHILIVDDVYTTGSTMYRSIEAIIASVASCRISIATLAATSHYRV